jgi:hypothetical protein
MCGTTGHLATASHSTSTPPLPHSAPRWHTAEVHNANVCPSEVAERGANANGATEDGFLRVNKYTAKPATAAEQKGTCMQGQGPPSFALVPAPCTTSTRSAALSNPRIECPSIVARRTSRHGPTACLGIRVCHVSFIVYR